MEDRVSFTDNLSKAQAIRKSTGTDSGHVHRKDYFLEHTTPEDFIRQFRH
jgi:hypothetical protein